MQQAWARLCKALGKEFVPYLSALVPSLLASAQLPPDLKIMKETDSYDEEKWKRLTFEDKFLVINTVKLQEKSSALTMLFWLADELKEYFFPYVNQLWPICKESLTFYHSEQVRTTSASLMPCILKSTTSYLKTNPNSNINISEVHMLYKQIIEHLLTSMENEPNLEVLLTLLNSFQTVNILIVYTNYYK